MSNFKSFFNLRIPNGEEIPLEAEGNVSTVLTQVIVDNNGKPYTRATLSAHVETLNPAEIEKDPDAPAIEHDVIIASFTPNTQQVINLSIGFTKEDITYLSANGADLIINGYTVPPQTELIKVGQDQD
ncbi:hypothetical protein TVAG_332960 [Trichomonas vaginalis G3]|uniref:Nucleoplasmin-like domain-containing protein n=1 Tax=Trichomonas vaginalis (strain ATCC PRA-98 / G3) TaxID=412133 RepID=A2EH92_TRIV3|nr:hypothetical protein TVAGG3_0933710 [Trichomonas vaginalis G3]EAY07971.1 hypothetical protein TVAG_332960 [Trichomonas vaginalis G3]KAI5486017.1 hypothetical protein TVAGG3_0933710 [Trichomonas vaginalis G3]|eukprot:XP_001320194.1 hypothetical protein [Trichomonas vaginalis G3]